MGSGLRVERVEAGGAVRGPVHQGGDLSGEINASDSQKDDDGKGHRWVGRWDYLSVDG